MMVGSLYDKYSFSSSTGRFKTGYKYGQEINTYSCTTGAYARSSGPVSFEQEIDLGRTIAEWKNPTGKTGEYLMKRTKTSVVHTNRTRGSFKQEMISNNTSLPTNNYSGSNWYVRGAQAKPYYLYKYIDGEIQTTYDVQTSQINTKKIDFTKERQSIKILVDANNTNYKISISKDNENWTEIEDKTLLDGEKDIQLPETWNSMYVKIERNGSVINQLVVK